jgi:predicted transcriptional regulator
MFKEEILKNERRRKIYSYIKKNPGVHLRSLQRRLKIPLSSLEYHLDYMVRKKVILKEKDRRLARYFVRGLEPADKKILSALRHSRFREIISIIMSNNKAKYQDLLEILDVPPSTLSFYLKHLLDQGILLRHRIGYENVYIVQDEDRVAKVLTNYKSSFLDKLVDRAIYTWMETQFRRRKKKMY